MQSQSQGFPIKNHFFEAYPFANQFWDEVFGADTYGRTYYQDLLAHFKQMTNADFDLMSEYAKVSFFNQGITFNVYADNQGTEKIFPFDLFPRIIPQHEWENIEKGIIQRNHAINLFLHDIYNEKKILKSGVVPAALVFSSPYYLKQMFNFSPVKKIYTHVSGTDIIRHKDGDYYVLEDNLRCPSGLSYVLNNRAAMKKTFPDLFFNYNIEMVNDYPEKLLGLMQDMAPAGADNPVCVVLSPGMFNSAYFEHSFMAFCMGIQLVEGRDLFVDKNFVYMKTIFGPQKVDVIYRRVDDEFLDPLVFREDSMLGVPGLISVFREGNVSLLNAPGTGVADDKAVYAYVPDMIKYYLAEEPILKNVHTYRCENESDRQFVLENMADLVIKPVDESGGYGLLIGNAATKAELEDFKTKVKANPRKYIAQPIMSLSVHPTYMENSQSFEPRHIDLRTFSLVNGDKSHVCKGGLTRVALKKGNLVVNSSQGGGSKDTWVLG
ncbi:MAG: circularly permuted type 2 ATP-grasp protein [Verrucomicrobia bacterium]|nr:circularly permuted type 2 ATP-grasp protein [Cytophagales bacterium]